MFRTNRETAGEYAFSSIKNRPHIIVKIWWNGADYTQLDKKRKYEFITRHGLCSWG